jgi:hypothetical protein
MSWKKSPELVVPTGAVRVKLPDVCVDPTDTVDPDTVSRVFAANG